MKKKLLAAACAAWLTGCGGGGDSGPPAPPAQFPVEPVLAALATTPATYTGTDAGSGTTLSLSLAPGPDAPFTAGAAPSHTYTTSAILKQNSATLGAVSTTIYYTSNPMAVVGQRSASDTITVTQRSAAPATATVGSSGPFFTGSKFLATVTGTWSLEPDTATTAFVCVNTSSNGILVTTEADCFKVDQAGKIIGFRATTTTNARSTNLNPVVDTFVFR